MNSKRVIVVGKVGNEWDGFMAGYNAAIKGAELADMQTQDEREGWWYAKRPAWDGGDDGVYFDSDAIEDDHDFIRHGC